MCLKGRGIRVHRVPKKRPIVAWRVWRLPVNWHDFGLLRSEYINEMWELVEKTADIIPSMPSTSGKNTRGYTSGIHAFKTEYGLTTSYPNYIIKGQVALWGKVVEHVNGYRAQHARILSLQEHPRLWNPSNVHDPITILCARYNVPSIPIKLPVSKRYVKSR